MRKFRSVICDVLRSAHASETTATRCQQCDEIWSFIHAKQKNVPAELEGVFGVGDAYTWTAICADSKSVPCWHVGRRDAVAAMTFIKDLASRLSHRVQANN